MDERAKSQCASVMTPEMPERSAEHDSRMKTNHFLFIASDYKPWPGGIAAYLDTLARALMSLGDTAKVLVALRPYETERKKFLETYEPWATSFPIVQDAKPKNWLGRKFVSLMEIFRCLSPNCRSFLEKTPLFEASASMIAGWESILSTEKPSVIIFGNLDFGLYPLALPLRERGIRFGVIAHGPEIGRLHNNKINDSVVRGVMLKGAEWIAANSHHTKSLLEMWGIPSEKIKVIHPPISEEVLQESAEVGPMSRMGREFGLVTICRLVRQKGVDVVLRALKILATRGIPFRYVIGGDGPERSALETLADEIGLRDKVHFQGHVEGEVKWRILCDSDVFVSPSRGELKIEQEGFGIAFIEAAAFGLPAIGSKTGGISDAVVDGQTGILVPAESPEALADALTFLYQKSDIRKRMGSAARERARRDFSPKAIATRFRDELTK